MAPKYKIDNVHTATLNGEEVKLFRVHTFHFLQKKYIYSGIFHAPKKTPNKKLSKFIK